MHYYEVIPRQIIRQDSSTLTYHSLRSLKIGHIVEIPVGKKVVHGVVFKQTTKPPYATKEIEKIIEETSIPSQLLQLLLWVSVYYKTHPALVLQLAIPSGITKKRRGQKPLPITKIRDRTNIVLNAHQHAAVSSIKETNETTAIVHGVTGSGKTAVYVELTKFYLSQKKSVIIITPEIALTSQIVDEFSNHFENIALFHSRQTEATRHLTWQQVLNDNSPLVVIGPRSALFLPVKNIGCIIIDEAHEPSLKQEQAPRYSALRVASVLAKNHNAKVILGSATPSITDYYTAKLTNKPILNLPFRARSGAIAPTISVVDMTKKDTTRKHRFLSNALLNEIETTLAQQKQSLIFHNRRGSASIILCDDCGWQALCPNCHVPFTLHADTHTIQCHICSYNETVPTSCPECKNVNVIFKGIGTKLVESELKKLFPKANIARFDSDTPEKESLHNRYKDLYEGTIDIIIGTQTVAKGLDLPKLQTVGIIQADAGLNLPDYGAAERTFQLLAQVVGRVGRHSHKSSIIVQSYQPNHSAIQLALKQDYEQFYTTYIKERKKHQFPPFVYLLKLTCVYKTEATAIKNAQKLATQLRKKVSSNSKILGPTPAFYERQHGTYRWQIIVKSTKRSALTELLSEVPQKNWQSELDPVSLL